MEIKQMLIPTSNKLTRPGIEMDPEFITIHETDNETAGADAEKHAQLQQRGNNRQASWQYQVDENGIIQSVPDNEVAWAAGDGYNGTGNRHSIHIEICVNKDGNFKKACENAAWLVRYLMAKHKIAINKVVQHNHWSGKNCPRHLRAGDWGIKWSDFITLLKEQPKPQPSVVYEAHVQKIGWQGAKKDGETAGTEGKSLRLEALTVKLENTDAKLEMQGHIEHLGWTSLRTNGEIIGTVGESLRLEAIKLKCDTCSISYRVHVQNIDWTAWGKDGDVAGTTGQSKRIEAIQIKLA